MVVLPGARSGVVPVLGSFFLRLLTGEELIAMRGTS